MSQSQSKISAIRDAVVSKLSKHDNIKLTDGKRTWRNDIEVEFDGKHIATISFNQKYSFDNVYITMRHAGLEPKSRYEVRNWRLNPYNQWNWGQRTYQKPESVVNAVVGFATMIPTDHDREVAKADKAASELYHEAHRIRRGLKIEPHEAQRLIEQLDADVISSFDETTQKLLGIKLKRLGEYHAKNAEYEAAIKAAEKLRKE